MLKPVVGFIDYAAYLLILEIIETPIFILFINGNL